jgi:coenzyme F420-reducing hydrogenase delta subunit/Pyruvate/2-oxoacid:ferredoxin oxidoreductase delta subunit
MPWLAPRKTPPAAEVRLGACNGCARCVADCPFGAVVMVPRTDGRDHPFQAQVIASQCAACGICAGACPSSTPFRRDAAVVTGIDLPQHPVTAMREELEDVLAKAAGQPTLVVFACRGAAAAPAPAGTAVIAVECAAMVPPSFIEYALRGGASGVAIAGCREGDCEFRFGDLLTQQRWEAAREPTLRPSVPRENVALAWCGRDRSALLAALSVLEARAAGPIRNALPARLKRLFRETPHA